MTSRAFRLRCRTLRSLYSIASFGAVTLTAAPQLLAQEPIPLPPLPPVDSAAAAAAASAIAADDIRRTADALAADSMRGHDIGGQEVKRAATYVAGELKRLGIEGVQSPEATMLHSYPMPGSLTPDYAETSVWFFTWLKWKGQTAVSETGDYLQPPLKIFFRSDGRFLVDTVTQRLDQALNPVYGGRVMLLTGQHTAASVRAAKLRDVWTIYLPPVGIDSAARQAVVTELKRDNHVIVVTDEDSAAFARRDAQVERPVIMEQFMERTSSPRRLTMLLSAKSMELLFNRLGLDMARLRADTTPAVEPLPATTLRFYMSWSGPRRTAKTGINVVGTLPGTATNLFPISPVGGTVVVSARLDSPDAAGLIALAKALSQPGARPRRRVTFVALTGTADANIGARSVAQDFAFNAGTMALMLDRIGAPPKDSVRIDGLRDFTFTTRPDWEALRRSKLELTVIDGGTILSDKSDHVAFVASGAGSLLVQGGPGDADAADSTSPSRFDADIAAQRLRLVYYMIQQIGNEPSWAVWTSEARRRRAAFIAGH